MMQTRIYRVADGHTVRLIEATSAATATRYCAIKKYRVGVAKPKDVAELMASGVTVEIAKPEQQEIEA